MALLLDEIRLNQDALRYGFAVGKVRVLETRTLDAAAYERLLDAPDFREQRRLLSETPYGRHLEDSETAEDVERALDAALMQFHGFLDEAALPESVVLYFRVRYDFANLKAIAKARLLGASEAGLLVPHGSIDTELFAGELSELPEPLGGLAARFADARESAAAGDVEFGAADIDRAVDRAMFAELAVTAGESKSRFLVDLTRLGVDLANVRALARAKVGRLTAAATKEQLIPGGTVDPEELAPLVELDGGALAAALGRIPGLHALSGAALTQLSTLDATLDSIAAAALRRARIGSVGSEPVISYVLEREAEVANLRVLLVGTLRGLDREAIRHRVMANEWV